MISVLDCTATLAGAGGAYGAGLYGVGAYGVLGMAVDRASITVDDSWSPFAQGTLVLPYDPALADALDSRGVPPRIDLTLTQSYGTGNEWNPVPKAPYIRSMDLGVRARQVDHGAGTITVTVSSDESRLHEYARRGSTSVSPSTLTVVDAVRLVLDAVFGSGGYTLTTDEGGTAISTTSAEWLPGVTGWDYLEPICTSAGLRLWCDETNVWRLDKPFEVYTPGLVVLAATQNDTRADDTIDRDSDTWYDAVQVTYTSTNVTTGATVIEYDSVGASSPTKVLVVKYDRPKPRDGAAQAFMDKIDGQGVVLGIDAVADFTAYPAMEARLTIPDTPDLYGWVSAVTWTLPDDEMTVTTRQLTETRPGSWLVGPAGAAWNDIPAGMSWTELDWEAVV